MKFTAFIFGWLAALTVIAGPTPAPVYPATQAEANAGTISNKFVSPATLAGWGAAITGPTNGTTSTTVTNIVNAMRPATRWTTNADNVQINGVNVTNVTAINSTNWNGLTTNELAKYVGTNVWTLTNAALNVQLAGKVATNDARYLATVTNEQNTVLFNHIQNSAGDKLIEVSGGTLWDAVNNVNSVQWTDDHQLFDQSGNLSLDFGTRTFVGSWSGLTPGMTSSQPTNTTLTQLSTNNAGVLTNLNAAQSFSQLTNVTANFTIPVTVNFVTAQSSSGSFTNTLPAAPPTGYSVIVKRTGANVVYVVPNTGQTADGSSAAVALNTAIYETRGFVWNGSTWWIW